ncbi:MAG: hypothetical protein JMDDDDMK_03015 [Acidobacteria bacterium]|nr:hypothetical protein [Acidobacteriota bacterium]
MKFLSFLETARFTKRVVELLDDEYILGWFRHYGLQGARI